MGAFLGHSRLLSRPKSARLPKCLEFPLPFSVNYTVMRLNKNQIEHLAVLIVRDLQRDGKVLIENKEGLVQDLISLLSEEFLKEDQLDQEVRELLGKHIDEIRKGNIEYQTMFRMIKTKLAKERNIPL
jgi:hypothetical protein